MYEAFGAKAERTITKSRKVYRPSGETRTGASAITRSASALCCRYANCISSSRDNVPLLLTSRSQNL